MRVLVVGGGGREHGLALALSRDSEVNALYAAPGNPGIAQVAKCAPMSPTSIGELVSFAQKEKIDLTVVGPEAPLAAGIVDTFRENRLRIFGPSKSAARIETSKSFTKDLCSQYHIPSPRWDAFTNPVEAEKALDYFGPPWVVKADGLAAGKGTTVTSDRVGAKTAIERELAREPGRVLLEEYIEGWEATFMATVSAGKVQWVTPVFQDYKPAYDGDTGPNTGGMGCFTHVPTVTSSIMEKVEKKILGPTIDAMEESQVHYQGVLNLNAIVRTGTDDPYVLEFNARFGDPEGQGTMTLVENGLAKHLYEIAEDSESARTPRVRDSACVLVVLASKGYPTSQSLGDKITIHPTPKRNTTILHAGTANSPTHELVTSGGRVLNVVATGSNVESARRDAYSVIGPFVQFPGMQYRSDIGALKPRQRKLQAAHT